MFVRALVMLGVLTIVAPAALADSDTGSIMMLHQQLNADFLTTASQLQYGGVVGQDTFQRDSQYRLRSAGSPGTTGSRMLTARRAGTIKNPVFRTTTRVGGLGRQISTGGTPSFSLGGISAGGGEGGAPSFGNLHEGGSGSGSFSFGGSTPGAQ